MRKIISLFLGTMTFLSTMGVGSVLAGGVDREEVLSDGTKLIYVSTDNILATHDKYADKAQALIDARYSKTKSWGIKIASLGAAGVGYLISEKLQGNHHDATISTKVASAVFGAVGFLFPDYRDWKLGREFCGYEESKGGNIYSEFGYGGDWGGKDGYMGVRRIQQCICGFMEKHSSETKPLDVGYNPLCFSWYDSFKKCHTDRWGDEHIDSGMVIIISPRSKAKNDPLRSDSPVFSQLQMGPHQCTGNPNHPGYLTVLKNIIARGK